MPINYKIKFRIVVSTFRNYSGPLRDCPISITRVNDAFNSDRTILRYNESWNMSSTTPTSEEIP